MTVAKKVHYNREARDLKKARFDVIGNSGILKKEGLLSEIKVHVCRVKTFANYSQEPKV